VSLNVEESKGWAKMETLAKSTGLSEGRCILKEHESDNVDFMPEFFLPVEHLDEAMTFFLHGPLRGLLQLTSDNIVRTEDGCAWYLTASDEDNKCKQHAYSDEFDQQTASVAGECCDFLVIICGRDTPH